MNNPVEFITVLRGRPRPRDRVQTFMCGSGAVLVNNKIEFHVRIPRYFILHDGNNDRNGKPPQTSIGRTRFRTVTGVAWRTGKRKKSKIARPNSSGANRDILFGLFPSGRFKKPLLTATCVSKVPRNTKKRYSTFRLSSTVGFSRRQEDDGDVTHGTYERVKVRTSVLAWRPEGETSLDVLT